MDAITTVPAPRNESVLAQSKTTYEAEIDIAGELVDLRRTTHRRAVGRPDRRRSCCLACGG